MAWVQTSNCIGTQTNDGEFHGCICDNFPGDILIPGTTGETKEAPCVSCGAYGVQIAPTICCNLSGIIYETT